ncbi:hypothetical protein [Aneurinibacillus uraniidurans]|uniref:hypothetical protein n=1 Tax=Aneurinibacillus uraniidurans TaxID=2966586 RepID=UPI002349C718|nr:hypothetical protein [Aneurinibacillus sp. B1]WCN36527.1 hypothetical protein PO771_11620 [Aneurinibacillus sp. B1]
MNQLTVRELMMIEDEIRAEQLAAKTMNWCASTCQDQTMRTQLEQMAEQHQLRVGELSQYFNRAKHMQ